MIFCGDFVYPFLETIDFSSLGDDFINAPKVVNIEALPLINGAIKIKKKGIALYATDQLYEIAKDLNIKCSTHANNHTFDYSLDIVQTKQRLKQQRIEPIGFGINLEDASMPYINNQENLIVLAFGWKTIGCQYATLNKPGVNPYSYNWVENQVIKWRNKYSDYRLVLFLHYNYELEAYPQPADRSFFHYLINLGVDAIFGHHPHIIQGYEYVKGKPIFYSLGNFYLPQIDYLGKKPSYPEKALKGICCDYQTDSNISVFMISQSKVGDKIKLIKKGKPETFSELVALSMFAGLSEKQYIRFFKTKRNHKRKGLPIYFRYGSRLNSFKDRFVLLRQSIIDSVFS